MRITIDVQVLFKGHLLGGLPPEDWCNLSKGDQFKQRLTFIASRARAITEKPYDLDNGLPANIWGEASRLESVATQAFQAASNGDFITASTCALEVGVAMERIQTLLAVYSGLKVRAESLKPKSAGGKSTALIKKNDAGQRVSEAKRLWKLFEETGRPERERAGLIAGRMGVKPNTVRGWLKKEGLR